MGSDLFLHILTIMKHIFFLSILLIGCIVILAMKYDDVTIPEMVRSSMVKSVDSTLEACNDFERILRNGTSSQSKNLLSSFARIRNSYKRIEWFLSQIEPESALLINGPPLPRLDEYVPKIIELEPEGLQTIEETLSEDEIEKHSATLIGLIRSVKQHLIDVKSVFLSIPLSDRVILEAIRSNIIRIGTLGISGFDTPSFSNSLQESAISLKASRIALEYYKTAFEKVGKSQSDRLFGLMIKAEDILKKVHDVDAFDRWTFIKDYCNPIYALIGELHRATGIETNNEVSRKNTILRYKAPTIYHTQAFDPYGFARNQYEIADDKKITLGKILFESALLSKSRNMSCATCHNPDRAFSDGYAKSPGSVMHTNTDRNTPGLLNVALSPRYFHDSRTNFLEEQIEHVVSNAIEFNTDYLSMAGILAKDSTIMMAFQNAYPTESGAINAMTISSALSAYIRSLISFESPVDSLLRGEKVVSLKGEKLSAVKRGLNLFMGKAACATCHFPPTYSGLVPPHFKEMESEVLGVPVHPKSKTIDPDMGKGGVYKYASTIYAHAFKTPGLRNIGKTAPYMHNGAYKTLEEVMEFYNLGGGQGLGIQVPNQTLPSDKLNLTKTEIRDIIEFMKALEDKRKY
ncbi:MAG: hypothetical protein EBU66_03130 [Bacteroidetes bacterium]|nr:hypothetical protein [bacterium]NBP63664.1 hypothetical protein [Bacteroidota bacterium]